MRPDPYAHAPRLPEGDRLDPRGLLAAVPDEVEVEIGPGRGWFMVERLEAVAPLGMIGFEIKRKWATVVDGRLQRRGLGDRGRVFAEDARAALPRLLPASVAVVHVNFPDPWWKKRHQKRLVLTAELVAEVARILRPGGELFVQTDVAERADAYERVIGAARYFTACEGQARVDDHPYLARSPRERRAMEDGIPVFRLRYRLAAGE
jgi:tRNA (guanine-N7-)-methyltransferase